MILQDDTHRHRVWQTKRELYLYQRNTVLDNLGQLYEVKSGLKPLSPEIHIVERCTGIKDMHENLMYAGDIVDPRYCKDEQMENDLLIIRYHEGGFGWWSFGDEKRKYGFIGFSGHTYYDEVVSRMEIVGNIHENGDLLNVQS